MSTLPVFSFKLLTREFCGSVILVMDLTLLKFSYKHRGIDFLSSSVVKNLVLAVQICSVVVCVHNTFYFILRALWLLNVVTPFK